MTAWNRSLRSAIETQRDAPHNWGFGHDRQCIESTFKMADRAEDGTVSMACPEGEFFVTLRARGYGSVELGPFLADRLPDPIEAVLDPVASLSGRVVTGSGAMEGVRVSLHRQVPPDRSVRVAGFACRSFHDAAESVETGPDGTFHLYPDVSGTWFLRAVKEGYAPEERGPLALDAGHGKSGIELRLSEGGSIAGRVIVAPDRNPSGILLAMSRGDGFPVEARTDANGAFLLDRLTPGPWLLEKRDNDSNGLFGGWIMDRGSNEEIDEWSCIVEEGKTTRYDIDLRHEVVCTLAGSFAGAEQGFTMWSASLHPLDPSPRSGDSRATMPHAIVSDDGRFSLEVLEAGPYSLTVMGTGRRDLHLRISDEVDLEGGEATWRWSVPFTKVEVRPPPSGGEGSGHLTYRWSGEGARKASMSFELESKTSVLLHPVPAGKFRIERREKDRGGEPTVVAEGETVVGETTVVTVQ